MSSYSSRVIVDEYRPQRRRLDLLTWPLIGPFLRWRHARTALQAPLFLLAALIVFDGLFGPQLAPKNLATVGVWLQYRGLVVLALLVAGNIFCMACPFMLPRRIGRWVRERFLGGGKVVPRVLRHKWLAVALVVIFFYAYERYSLWASPWLTAWIVAGYFLAAFVVDTWFRGAAFCKYVCPVGQFNLFASLVSPLEIKIREPETCMKCTTKDCITAGPTRNPLPLIPGARGCELWLFQERKAGNMDCTFCLDCVHACPHDNIGLIGRLPTRELWTDPFRSGIGHFSRRPDLAALVGLLAFGGFMNAFGMIRPVYALREQLATWLGVSSQGPALMFLFLLGLIVLPALLLIAAGLASRRLSGRRERLRPLIQRYVYAFVPLGFGMWLAHYSFHFLTGGLTLIPVVQSFLADIGLYRGTVDWTLGPLVPGEWLFPIEALFLYLGTFGSLVTAFRIALDRHVSIGGADDARGRAAVLGAALPWMALSLLFLAGGLWILLQPMEMRGTMMMPGVMEG